MGQNIKKPFSNKDYLPFKPSDYLDNPVALARIKAGITEEELAKRMNRTSSYIKKIENQSTVAKQTLLQIKAALNREDKRHALYQKEILPY